MTRPPDVNIDLDRKCRNCGKRGVVGETKLCLKCVTPHIVAKVQKGMQMEPNDDWKRRVIEAERGVQACAVCLDHAKDEAKLARDAYDEAIGNLRAIIREKAGPLFEDPPVTDH